MKLGIMGGTFDPVHYGHLGAAKEVRLALSLDYVLFIPAGDPVYKRHYQVTATAVRYQMLKEAIAEEEAFLISDMEVRREGATYAVDTLKELHRMYPEDTEFYYIIGADVVAELDTWKSYEEDFRMCTFAAVCRPGYTWEQFDKAVTKMTDLGAKIIPVEIIQRDISSREIRQKAAKGESVEDLVPPCVQRRILQEGLYSL